MSKQHLNLEDIRFLNSAERIADTFERLGYTKVGERIGVEDLDLSARNVEAIYDAHLIADQGEGSLQVVLLELHDSEWETPSMASTRMKSIATQIGKRPSEFLLLATTKKYDQLMLVNPRKTFDDKTNLKVSIRKLLIDRKNPTAYDRDRLESLAVNGKDPQTLYKTHCEEFDVEKLTKKFYEGYKKLFEWVQQAVKDYNPDPYFEDPDRLHQFSQRLLGRIMFLYFLQKKEFLADDRRFLDSQYRKHQYGQDDCDYYTEILEPLFFDTLNKQRPNFDSQWGKIPYLNGGLFDRDYGPDVRDTAGKLTPETITLPNTLFNPGNIESILAYFNSYNFTVSENVAGDEDIAVDPEMLGKVFENMLVAEERGKSGTFYTPRGIVQFMCAEVLARYLVDETGIPLETAQRLVDYDPDLSTQDLKILISANDAQKLKQAITTLKVLDPAVGSGAFPLGMMQLIVNVRMAVAHREEEQAPKRGTLRISHWKRDIIANNLYGVDIKPEAIEIAKLRMWLSLVVDIPTIDNVQPLPNLDYKLMCGDSLISKINGQTIIPIPGQAEQLTLGFETTELDRAIADLVRLEKQYFNVSAEARQGLRLEILEAEKRVFAGAIADQRNVVIQQQQQLEREIKQLKKPQKKQLQERETLAARLKGLDEFEDAVKRGDRALNFFQYYLHFRDVFESKGGFDVVVGNPPYVRQEQIKEIKPALEAEFDCYTGVADLFVYFYEQGFKLLKPKGHLIYITSNKYFRAGYGEKLRKYLADNSTIEVLIDFGDANVFEAIAYPSIIVVKKHKPKEHKAKVLTWQEGQALEDFVSVYEQNQFPLKQTELKPDGWRLESPEVLRLLDKLRKAGTPLGEYVNGRFYRGILTGFNEAFVVDRETRDRLITEHPSSAEILKPFLRGRDIKRWTVNFAKQYLIKIESSENKEHPWSGKPEKEAEEIFAKTYPAIHQRFNSDEYRKKLIKRTDQGKYFWELRSCAYWDDFDKPKILYPDIYERQSFVFEKIGFYSVNTTYFIPTSESWICGLLNSSIIEWFYSHISNKVRGGYLRAFSNYMKQIPVPQASKEEKKIIEILVDYILYLTQQLKDAPSAGKELMAVSNDTLMLSYFDQILDAVIMELYLSKDMHAENKYFIRYLLQEKLPDINKIKSNKIDDLRAIFQHLFNQGHPLRKNLYFLGNLNIVKLIREK